LIVAGQLQPWCQAYQLVRVQFQRFGALPFSSGSCRTSAAKEPMAWPAGSLQSEPSTGTTLG
jgi:hypothetical protein